jgi:hypothetical protein
MNAREKTRLAGDWTVADLEKYPVWQAKVDYDYDNPLTEEEEDEGIEYEKGYDEDDIDETAYVPVLKLPVAELNSGLEVGTQVTLANGKKTWAVIGGIESSNPKSSAHFMTIAFEKDGDWFLLARPMDTWNKSHGPEELAKFLGMNVDDIFPISYDISKYVAMQSPAHSGQILKEPGDKISEKEASDAIFADLKRKYLKE